MDVDEKVCGSSRITFIFVLSTLILNQHLKRKDCKKSRMQTQHCTKFELAIIGTKDVWVLWSQAWNSFGTFTLAQLYLTMSHTIHE